MIRHIFKIIWNERKVNAWIMLEYIIVFCVLWFCCDFLYYIGKSYFEDPGHDTKHTYLIKMGKKHVQQPEDAEDDKTGYEELFTERVKRFPGIESLGFSKNSIPYGMSSSANGYQPKDSIWTVLWYKNVTPGFFDVYRIKLQSGRELEENDRLIKNNVALAPRRDGMVGEFGMPEFPVKDIKVMRQGDKEYNVVAVYEKNKRTYLDPFPSSVYELIPLGEVDLANVDISIRVSPEEDHNFIERFMAQMREQLFIGPYFLVNVISAKEIEKISNDTYVADNLNSVLAITGFLFVNIFLALIGTFWFRTVSRRNQIGLRIALGSSKRGIKLMMYSEAIIMLFMASILSTYICLNLAHIDLLSSLGIPLAQRSDAGLGNTQDVINYFITFGFLAIVSCLAIWYPASRASNIPPAEALRDE